MNKFNRSRIAFDNPWWYFFLIRIVGDVEKVCWLHAKLCESRALPILGSSTALSVDVSPTISPQISRLNATLLLTALYGLFFESVGTVRPVLMALLEAAKTLLLFFGSSRSLKTVSSTSVIILYYDCIFFCFKITFDLCFRERRFEFLLLLSKKLDLHWMALWNTLENFYWLKCLKLIAKFSHCQCHSNEKREIFSQPSTL